jgi:hypothetical protein
MERIRFTVTYAKQQKYFKKYKQILIAVKKTIINNKCKVQETTHGVGQINIAVNL